MAVFEWVELVLGVLLNLLSLALTVLWLMVLWKVYEHFTQRLPGDNVRLGPRAAIRRLYCKHRIVARVRSPLGRMYTACARCAKDVNMGKPQEEWR